MHECSAGPASATKQGILGQAKAGFIELKHKMKQSVQKKESNGASFLKTKTGKEAVLCMDGGGIRGLVLTELLFALEEVTGQPVAELFDWISGTSTGSYLALAVATGGQGCSLIVFELRLIAYLLLIKQF